MGLGRIWARSDEDRKRHGVGACVVEELLHPPGEVGLGLPDEVAFVDETLERDVRDLCRPADRIKLVLVLDHAQLFDEAVARNSVDSSCVQPRVALVGERGALEADAAGEMLREGLVEVAFGLHELGAFDGSGAFRVPEVGEQPNAVGLDEQGRVRAHESGEVANVRRVGDEQRLLELGPQTVDPVVHEPAARNVSASR